MPFDRSLRIAPSILAADFAARDERGERGLEHGGWATIVSSRSAIEARVLVTERMVPLVVSGRDVYVGVNKQKVRRPRVGPGVSVWACVRSSASASP